MALLLCDLDDTILDRSVIFREWALEFAQSQGQDDAFVGWLIGEDERGYRSRAAFWSSVKNRLRLDDPLDFLISTYRERLTELTTCTADVVNALKRARNASWTIAIVTNGDLFQHQKIAAANLDPLVDAVCISEVEGIRKPDRRILDIAAKRCGSSLEGAWMIGDDAENDVGVAVAAGIDSIWLTMGRTWDRPDFHPTLTADSFSEGVNRVLAMPSAEKWAQ
jgi:putative hydrolase of the HAD superfamily